MNEIYHEYFLRTLCTQLKNGRYSISVEISLERSDGIKKDVFHENKKYACTLLQESEKEAIRLGKNLIDMKMVGF